MGAFTFFLAVLALIFAALVIKQRLFTAGQSSHTEYVEIEGATMKSDDRNASPQSIGGREGRTKKAVTPTMSQSERDIRQQWGWDTKGTSLNQPAR